MRHSAHGIPTNVLRGLRECEQRVALRLLLRGCCRDVSCIRVSRNADALAGTVLRLAVSHE